MIARSDMFAPLLEADPSFNAAWQEFLADWSNEPELPEYLALGDLVRHLESELARGHTDRFPAIFHVVERWLVEGEGYVSDAAHVGLLEALQNCLFDTPPLDFWPWLGPESRRRWNRIAEG